MRTKKTQNVDSKLAPKPSLIQEKTKKKSRFSSWQ
jgi:hypothetical protein